MALVPPKPKPSLLRGALVLGSWQIDRALWDGPLWRVYLAYDPRTPERKAHVYAVRQLPSVDLNHLEAFARYTEIWKGLEHPSIVPMLESGVDLGGMFAVTPAIEGATLASRWKARTTPESAEDTLRWVQELAIVLDALHQRTPPIVHRALMPETVFLCRDGTVRLLEAGFAYALSVVDRADLAAARMTAPFRAPEDRATAAPTAALDQYALAVLAYFCLAGPTPEAQEMLGSALRQATGTVFHPAVERALARALAPVADERFVSCGSFADALEAALTIAGDDLLRMPPPPEPAAPEAERSDWPGNVSLDAVLGDAEIPDLELASELLSSPGIALSPTTPAAPAPAPPVAPAPASKSALRKETLAFGAPSVAVQKAAAAASAEAPTASSLGRPSNKPTAEGGLPPRPTLGRTPAVTQPTMPEPLFGTSSAVVGLDPKLAPKAAPLSIPPLPKAAPKPKDAPAAAPTAKAAEPPSAEPPSADDSAANSLGALVAAALGTSPSDAHPDEPDLSLEGDVEPGAEPLELEPVTPTPAASLAPPQPILPIEPVLFEPPTVPGFSSRDNDAVIAPPGPSVSMPASARALEPEPAFPDVPPPTVAAAPPRVTHADTTAPLPAHEDEQKISPARPSTGSRLAIAALVVVGLSAAAAGTLLMIKPAWLGAGTASIAPPVPEPAPPPVTPPPAALPPPAPTAAAVPGPALTDAAAVLDAAVALAALDAAQTAVAVAAVPDAAQLAVAARADSSVAAAVPDAAQVAVAVAVVPDAAVPVAATGPLPAHPGMRERRAVSDAVQTDVSHCGSHLDRHARLTVLYEGSTGAARTITFSGTVFDGEPVKACIEAALRAHPLPPFSAAEYEIPYRLVVP